MNKTIKEVNNYPWGMKITWISQASSLSFQSITHRQPRNECSACINDAKIDSDCNWSGASIEYNNYSLQCNYSRSWWSIGSTADVCELWPRWLPTMVQSQQGDTFLSVLNLLWCKVFQQQDPLTSRLLCHTWYTNWDFINGIVSISTLLNRNI